MKIKLEKIYITELSRIQVGQLFELNSSTFMKTNKIMYATVDSEPNTILCVNINTGHTIKLETLTPVNKVEQCEVVHLKLVK